MCRVWTSAVQEELVARRGGGGTRQWIELETTKSARDRILSVGGAVVFATTRPNAWGILATMTQVPKGSGRVGLGGKR